MAQGQPECSCPLEPVELGDGPGSALRPTPKQARGAGFGENRIFGLFHPLSFGGSAVLALWGFVERRDLGPGT